MANVQIPNLPAAIAVSGAEQLEAVQAGTSVRVTAAQIASLASSGSAGVVANIAATGTTGATSAPLTGVINAVTSATTGVAVGIYITAGVGINQTVFNATAVDLAVYPSNNGTGQIDNLSVGASIPLAAYTSKTFTKDNSGVFRTVANGLINSTLIGYEKPNYIIMKGVTATGSSTVAETRMEVTGTDTNIGMLFAAKGDGWFRARRLVAQATTLTPTSGALPAVQMGIVNSLSGTITTGTASAFSWQIAGDTASATGATGGNIYYMNGLNEFGGTGMTGGRIGLNVSHVLNMGDTSNNPSGNYFHTGIQSQTTASFRDGGVYGDPSGELFAFFGSSELRPAARHWNHVKAAEYNISIDRYGSASFKSGITIGNSTTDGEESIIEESFLAIGAKKANASSSTGLRTGILYGGAGGFWGIPPYGSLIEAAPTTVTGFGPAPAMSAAYGIDWSLVSFLGASWRMADVTIDGAGNIGTNTVNAGLTLQTLNGITAKSASVASYTVLAGGIFTGRPTFTVAASPGGGTTATGNVATMGMKLITGITAAGSGYAVGELLTPTSGTGTQASIRVVAVDGSGGVTYAVINRVSEVEQVGSYTATALPSSPFATTSSGSGTGAQFTANYTILTCALGTGGTLYPQFPAPQVSIDTSLLIRRAKIIPVMTASNTALLLANGYANYLSVTGAASSSPTTVAAAGTDSNIYLRLLGKGTSPTEVLRFSGGTSSGSPSLFDGTRVFNLRNNPTYSGFITTSFLSQINSAGTATNTGQIVHHLFNNIDTLSAASAGSVATLAAYTTVNAGARSPRIGFQSSVNIAGATSDPALNRYFHQAIYGEIAASATAGGTSGPGNEAGNIFGGNIVAKLKSGGLYFNSLVGWEVGVTAATGSSTVYKNGLQIVTENTDNVSGSSGVDTAALIVNQAYGTQPGWDMGLSFGHSLGWWPMKANSTLVGTEPAAIGGGPIYAASYGVDFNAVTFSSGAFRSNGFLVDGAGTTTTTGRLKGTRVVTAAGAVTVAATDEVIIINKTVGAATTVDLPAGVTKRTYVIKDGKGDAAANNITITPAAGTIDGAATLVINTNYGRATLLYNGTQWNQIA